MNHKLQNTILASATVGAALLFGLLAAQPVGGGTHQAATRHDPGQLRPAAGLIAEDLRTDLARDIDRRARRFESDLSNAGSASEALAMASALFATSVAEATLASVLEDVANHQPQASRVQTAQSLATDEVGGRQVRRNAALATPYFSTARGLRRGNGE